MTDYFLVIQSLAPEPDPEKVLHVANWVEAKLILSRHSPNIDWAIYTGTLMLKGEK